ncbi:hypothetical protein SAMN05444149_11064 [Pseudosulfitobacter pseudonitzschiae]|nr:hypothetical protein SAMN05444149_11064 [Pseudosulfitobacter pseudonitzschiae]
MVTKQMGVPFQEGYLWKDGESVHAFTDYRWNTGLVERSWKITPFDTNGSDVELRPFLITSSSPSS